MFKIALKSLLSHKLRMLLTTISIVLGVSFITGTFMFTDSIGNSFGNLFSDVFRGIDLTVSPEEPEFGNVQTTLSDDDLAIIQATEGIRIVTAEVGGNAQIIDAEGNLVGGNGPPTLGFSWNDEPELNVLVIKDGNGRAPQAPGEVVIDANTVKLNDFSIGDTVSIAGSGKAEDFELVGIVSFGEADTLLGATISVFEFSEAQRFFGFDPGQYGTLTAKVDTDTTPEEVQARLQESFGDSATVTTAQQETDNSQEDVDGVLGAVNNAISFFGLIALFVAGFIIYNTFQIIVSQRAKELALLRAVGATRGQVVRAVMYEALAIGAIASIIGIGAGVLLAQGIAGILDAAGLGLPQGELEILPRTIIAGLTVGVGATLIAALLPAVKASRVSPVEALSDNESSAKQRSLKRRATVSSIVTAIGGFFLYFGLFGDSDLNPLIPTGIGVGIMFFGIAAFAPLLSAPLANILGWPFAKLKGVAGKIAQENTKKTPRRTAFTAAALMIGVSLVTLSSVFAASVNKTIDVVVEESFPTDVIALPVDFSSPDGIPRELSDELRELDSVETVAQAKYADIKIDNEDVRLTAFVTPIDFSQVVTIEPSEQDFANLVQGTAYVRTTLLDEKGWQIGDILDVDFGPEKKPTTIVGTYNKDFDTKLILNAADYDSVFGVQGDTFLSANFKDGVDFEAARAEVTEVASQYPTVNVQDLDELIAEQKSFINQALTVVWALLGFAIIIAVIGITNTLALSIFERRRELGLLRAVGMTKRQVRSMVRAEAIIISLFGAALGIVIGVFFGWALIKALESEGFTEFVIPVGQVAGSFVAAAIAGVIASIWPAFSAARVNVLEAINFE